MFPPTAPSPDQARNHKSQDSIEEFDSLFDSVAEERVPSPKEEDQAPLSDNDLAVFDPCYKQGEHFDFVLSQWCCLFILFMLTTVILGTVENNPTSPLNFFAVLTDSCTRVAWPSGLRRWIKAPVSSEAWVQIPPLPMIFFKFTAFFSFMKH